MTAKEFVQSIQGKACPIVYGFAVGILEKNDWDFRSLFSDAVEREYRQLPMRTLSTFETSLAWAIWMHAHPWHSGYHPWFHMAVNYPGKCRDVRWNRAKKALKAAGITHYSPKKAKKEIL